MRGPAGGVGVLQIHPSRLCNLTCRHCYSGSGPRVRGEIGAGAIHRLLDDAVVEGYRVLGLSGGEPLLYEPLATILTHAKSLGFAVTMTTNAFMLPQRAAGLKGSVDLVAISLDGGPELHNWMRRSQEAFEALEAGAAALRSADIPFGVIFTATRASLPDLPWAAAFASREGASLFQVHALEAVGRGAALHRAQGVGPREAAIVYLETHRIAAAYPQMSVQCDLTDAILLRDMPERALAIAPDPEERLLASIISPLVLEHDGVVVPLQYGFDRRYALGSILTSSLRDLKGAWIAERLTPFTGVCRTVWDELPSSVDDWAIVNWFQRMYLAAQRGEHIGEVGRFQ